MKSINEMSTGELAAFISTHLSKADIEVVLSGGGCVSIHSENKYVSMDLDFINIHFIKRKKIREVLSEIGFHEKNRYFVHPDTDFIIEFPAGPLAVGEEPVKCVEELIFETGTVKILSPTDCVKDRLTWFFYSNDLQCLEQAILVSHHKEIDINEVEHWSKNEGKSVEFNIIKNKLMH